MTYDAIVSLQARIPAQMGRDDLVMFEDALGRPTPFHLGFIDCCELPFPNPFFPIRTVF